MNDNLSSLQFQRVPVPEGHGSDDYESDEGEAYTVHALAGKQRVGSLDYNLTEHEAHVRWVESQQPGRGIGGALVRHLSTLHPDRDLTTNGFTDEGERLAHYFGRSR